MLEPVNWNISDAKAYLQTDQQLVLSIQDLKK